LFINVILVRRLHRQHGQRHITGYGTIVRKQLKYCATFSEFTNSAYGIIKLYFHWLILVKAQVTSIFNTHIVVPWEGRIGGVDRSINPSTLLTPKGYTLMWLHATAGSSGQINPVITNYWVSLRKFVSWSWWGMDRLAAVVFMQQILRFWNSSSTACLSRSTV